jgi:HSP20 family protein
MARKTPSSDSPFDDRWDQVRDVLETVEQIVASGWYPARRELLSRLSGVLPPSGLPVWIPEADLEEGPREVSVAVALPGVEKADIRLEVGEDFIAVSGRRRADRDGAARRELPGGEFRRRIRLPAEVKPATAKAVFRNGVLKVTAARARAGVGRSVKIE